MNRRQQEQTIANLIRSLGASLRNRGLYPPAHPLVRSPLEKCFSEVVPFFADRRELALAISEGTLVFEGVPIFHLTSALDQFVRRLASLGIQGIVFEKGLSPRDLELFIGFLHETKDEGLSASAVQARIEERGVTHLRVKALDDEEDDHLLARRAYDNAVHVLISVMQEVRLGRIPSGAEPGEAVEDVGGMLTRNRDAVMALTLIKNFDEYTYTHSVNVCVIALAIADALGLSGPEKTEIGVAGLLHDVGKTQLALDLIRKPGKLTPAEFAEIRKHPEEGFVLLGKMSHIRPDSAYMVREHHMRYDRQGYPTLGPEYAIHPRSQIIAVADCYDALTTMRSYQAARAPLEALEIMENIAGQSIDGNLLAVLKNVMGAYPIGTLVRLSSMEVGVVTAVGPHGEGPWKISVLVDSRGMTLGRPEEVDIDGPATGADRPVRSILGTVDALLYPDLQQAVGP